MKLPTEAEVVAIKADAMKRFASERALLVQIEEPVEAAVVVAPYDVASYSKYIDAVNVDPQTAYQQTLVNQLLWPALDQVLLLNRLWPAVAAKVAGFLLQSAGYKSGSAQVVRLTEENVPTGAPSFAELHRQCPNDSLWLATMPQGIAFVMRAPLPEVYIATKSEFAKAFTDNAGIITCVLHVVKESIVWTPEPIDTVLQRAPAMIPDLREAVFAMGGSAAKATSKSL